MVCTLKIAIISVHYIAYAYSKAILIAIICIYVAIFGIAGYVVLPVLVVMPVSAQKQIIKRIIDEIFILR